MLRCVYLQLRTLSNIFLTIDNLFFRDSVAPTKRPAQTLIAQGFPVFQVTP